MDNEKTGRLIKKLRTEAGMTQKQLAGIIGVSDKAISKWERGKGAPDVSLLNGLSDAFGVNTEKLLLGEIIRNDSDGGNMKRVQFYVCPCCSDILTATGKAEISCCGRKLEPLKSRPADEAHSVRIQTVEDDYYAVADHEMTKGHFLSFVAYVMTDRVLLMRLYPEQNAELRFPRMRGGRLLFHCVNHGLFEVKL